MTRHMRVQELGTQLRRLCGRAIADIVAGEPSEGVLILALASSMAGTGQAETVGRVAKATRREQPPVEIGIACAWRLEVKGRVVCGYGNSAKDDVLQHGLAMLAGVIVQDVHLNERLDLCITFSGGLIIRIFCDNVYDDDYENCYCITLENGESFSVRGNGSIRHNPRR